MSGIDKIRRIANEMNNSGIKYQWADELEAAASELETDITILKRIIYRDTADIARCDEREARIADLERERDRATQQHERCAEKLFNTERELAKARKDAERYRWLCADLFGEERIKRNGILCRMPVMSYSAASTDIDAAMRQEEE